MHEKPAILQFGTSRFLLAHADFFVSEALAEGKAIGTIAVVQTTSNPQSSQRIAALNEARSYPVMIRGLADGKPFEKEYQARGVTTAYSAHQDWPAILDLGASVDVILSNTGDKGFELDKSDDSSLLANPEALPKSFPAKLLVLLHHRWQHNPDAPLSVFPCELISRNGDKLRSILIDLAHDWKLPDSFVQWLETRCVFANSLV
ncbi:MAG TPA: mannitol dehydrogenase family protein, partial [Ochrobactrum intermedium]|nr:mannitol dehydrogenase family protein [Brucella intermedia]